MLYYGKDVKKKYEALERAPNALRREYRKLLVALF
jgi:hypothetical protein